MKCPPEIAAILHEILRIGLLRIRACGWDNDAERYAIEADHLHNLPTLLADYKPELLELYLDVERNDYMRRSSGEMDKQFETLWKSLASYLPNRTIKVLAS